MATSELGIIVPAYNEGETIGAVVGSLANFGEVIVVDDGSSDDTAMHASRCGAQVVSHVQNLGYDSALNSGFKRALELGLSYALTFDADGQHPASKVEEFAHALKGGAQLVLGVRPDRPRISELVIGYYFQSQFGVNDILCGLKGYNLDLYRSYGKFDSVGSIGMELAFVALKAGVSFKEISISVAPRLDQSRFGNLLRSNLRILTSFIRLIHENPSLVPSERE